MQRVTGAGDAFMRYSYCRPFVIDDDPDFTTLLVRSLEKAGVPGGQIRAATTGEKAIALLENLAEPRTLSFLLVDIHLPGKSGLEVLEWVRSRPEFQTLPVFMISSDEEPRQVARAFELKALSFFVKPVDLRELHNTVEGILAFWHRRSVKHV
jgi:CheY-like chemotaxis protein